MFSPPEGGGKPRLISPPLKRGALRRFLGRKRRVRFEQAVGNTDRDLACFVAIEPGEGGHEWSLDEQGRNGVILARHGGEWQAFCDGIC